MFWNVFWKKFSFRIVFDASHENVIHFWGYLLEDETTPLTMFQIFKTFVKMTYCEYATKDG